MSKIFDALRKAEQNRRKTRTGARKVPGKKRKARGQGGADAVIAGLDSDFTRSLYTLRNSIDTEIRDKGSRVVMITSSIAGEGKTTITGFLARVIASNEMESVLLVDCAVKNSRLGKLFGVEKDKGIIDYLLEEAEIKDIITNADHGALDIVNTGIIRKESTIQPLFNSDRMRFFINQMAEKYDYVLFDTSPVLDAPETSILSPQMDGVVLVVRAGKTKREVIKRAMMMLNKQGGNLIGSVLNRKLYHIPEFIYKRV
ncbi:MAG: CpsD/CapB family tyrosine-protein kinase [Candidatus Krumholzibacteriales bacterium]